MKLQKQLAKVLNLGGFHLTKWISNKEKQMPELESPFSVKLVKENIIMPVKRALRVIWDTSSDCLSLRLRRGTWATLIGKHRA